MFIQFGRGSRPAGVRAFSEVYEFESVSVMGGSLDDPSGHTIAEQVPFCDADGEPIGDVWRLMEYGPDEECDEPGCRCELPQFSAADRGIDWLEVVIEAERTGGRLQQPGAWL